MTISRRYFSRSAIRSLLPRIQLLSNYYRISYHLESSSTFPSLNCHCAIRHSWYSRVRYARMSSVRLWISKYNHRVSRYSSNESVESEPIALISTHDYDWLRLSLIYTSDCTRGEAADEGHGASDWLDRWVNSLDIAPLIPWCRIHRDFMSLRLISLRYIASNNRIERYCTKMSKR